MAPQTKILFDQAYNLIGRHIESPLCLKCGSFQIQKSAFCGNCENNFLAPRISFYKVQNLSAFKNQPAEHVPIYSFIRWKKYESDSLSEWVYLLKNKVSQPRWDWVAENLSSNPKIQELKLNQNSILIPIPGHRKSYHTQNFCKALSRVFGCAVIENTFSFLHLERQQKRLGLQERGDIKLILNEEITGLLQYAERLVLVDDIVTTGATLKSAVQTLYKAGINHGTLQNKDISAVTLFYRV